MDHRDHNGIVRRLGWVAPSAEHRKLRAAQTSLQSLRASLLPNEPPIFSMAQLLQILQARKVDFVTGQPLSLVNNQGQEGACACASNCGASQRGRWLRGQPLVNLSWPYLYDQVNGGQDNGSNIIQASMVFQTTGVPELALYPKSLWVPGKMPVGATIYTEDVVITMDSALSCATAVVMGIFPNAPIDVDGTFENFTGDGVAWGNNPRGSSGNHAIYLAGLAVIAGVIYFVLVNSWDTNWGPFGNGTCLCPFAAIDNCAEADDVSGHASMPTPPQNTADLAPAPVTAA